VNRFFDDSIDNLVASDKYWLFGGNFNKSRHFNQFFDHLFHLINLGNLMLNRHNFILINRHFDEFFLDSRASYRFFLEDLNFLDFFSNVRHLFFYFFDFFLDHNFFLNLDNFLHSWYLMDNLNNFLDCLRHFLNFFNFLLNQNYLLNDFVTLNWHFVRNHHCFLNLD